MAVVDAEVLDLRFGEPVSLVEFLGEDVVHPEVVEAGEYALLGYLHHARYDGEAHVRVAFQRQGIELADETYDIIIGVLVERVVDGVVVLVDEDYRFHSMVLFQHLAQCRYEIQGPRILEIHRILPEIQVAEGFGYLIRRLEVFERTERPGQHPFEHRKEHVAPAHEQVFHAETDHRIRVPVLLHLRMGVDLQPVEPLVALVLQIEEGIDHGEV